jgi:hypothetical protein
MLQVTFMYVQQKCNLKFWEKQKHFVLICRHTNDLHKKFCTPHSSASLVITIKLKAEYRIPEVAMLFVLQSTKRLH